MPQPSPKIQERTITARLPVTSHVHYDASKWTAVPRWTSTRTRPIVLAVAGLAMLAALFRCYGLNYSGFSEDEINKVNAVRAYRHGDLTANAEHPMVMKTAMLVSSVAAEQWNRAAVSTGWPVVSAEAALRFPNALAGALTVVPLFLLARAFFGPAFALWASLLYAVDVNVTGINRIGKEDTFLVLFLLLGAWCYERARELHLRERRAPHLWYVASGAAFGLMLASKYMPYYLGLWALFGLAASAEEQHAARLRPWPPASRPRPQQHASKWFYVAIVAGFLVANPVILLPGTWAYLLAYLREATVTHHGAFFAGHVYPNMVGDTPWGLPWHFYLEYLGVKTPLPVLGAVGLGLAELVRRRRQRGAVFARVFLLFFLLPASLFASKFARYLLPSLIVLDMVAALGVVRLLELISRYPGARLRAFATAVCVALIVGAPLAAQASAQPYASVFENIAGKAIARPGTLFPNDELYDAGVREAVEWVAAHAAGGAVIVTDAPGAAREYAERSGRSDLAIRSLSMAGVGFPPAETWVLVQDSHACFESQPMVDQFRRRQQPAFTYRVAGATAVDVFRMPW